MEHSNNELYENHKSDNFKKGSERFGVYRSHSKAVYNSEDYNSKNKEHHKYIFFI